MISTLFLVLRILCLVLMTVNWITTIFLQPSYVKSIKNIVLDHKFFYTIFAAQLYSFILLDASHDNFLAGFSEDQV